MTATTLARSEARSEAGPSRGALSVLLAGVFISLLAFFISGKNGAHHSQYHC